MEPWDKGKRAQIKRKIDKEAARAAARLGANSVVIVALFSDGNYMHVQDGGSAPMPYAELYERMLSAHKIVEASGGEDVEIQ